MTLRLAQLGLGPIGLQTLQLAASKPWAEIVGAIEVDPARRGQDLGEITGLPALAGRRVYGTLDELLAVARPDLVLQTTVSSFAVAYRQIVPLVGAGIHVVSSCEELVYPQLRQPKLAGQLDELCRAHRVAVLGAGVNPGFVMDVLPLVLSTVSSRIEAIHIERVVNASTRRAPLQKKIGSGMARNVFQPMLERGEAGHAGLRESLALLSHALGWELRQISEKSEALTAERSIHTRHFQVEPGQVRGIHQRIEATAQGNIRLTLDITMALDAPNPHDAIRIEGDPPLDVIINGGIAGDAATAACLVNLAPLLVGSAPGLRLLTDLPLPRLA